MHITLSPMSTRTHIHIFSMNLNPGTMGLPLFFHLTEEHYDEDVICVFFF
jgi:hypothetical protein